jgi:hypothetical protein
MKVMVTISNLTGVGKGVEVPQVTYTVASPDPIEVRDALTQWFDRMLRVMLTPEPTLEEDPPAEP